MVIIKYLIIYKFIFFFFFFFKKKKLCIYLYKYIWHPSFAQYHIYYLYILLVKPKFASPRYYINNTYHVERTSRLIYRENLG
ncbi:hypothetical protein H8356DRAFT_1678646 [Neocallimastix lanati (nom. inval.)]|nr:hypothetical protein H8356DRAFT_1678646 [Neocallimastix sp. JGI-2020a]